MHSSISPKSANTCHTGADHALSWLCGALTPNGLDALATEWEDLAQAASEKNIFQFPKFIRNSLPLLADQEPKIVTVRHSGLLIGIVILRRDMGYAKLPVPFWKSALHPEQYLGSPLVRAGFEEEFVTGLTSWLDQASLNCGFVQLAKISGDGPLAHALFKHSDATGRGIIVANRHKRAAIAPTARCGTKDDSHLTSSRRKSIRRAQKRLHNAGEISIERLSERDQLDDWADQFLEMEDTGWKHEAGSSILSCPNETALYRATIRDSFESGNLTLTRLHMNGKPIAFTLDVLAPPIGYCLKSAILPEYRKFSAGVLMEFETLKYYLGQGKLDLIDSCTHPDNTMLNELWPDRREIMDIAVSRRGLIYSSIFAGTRAAKAIMQRFSHV
ncbi:MAG: GNAT family N-acetyltransferase [Erythrobacter sp.]|uniref:GNAT family N-acetyltransferase n=1 Tax=Erythrobacter sp. TaxID=1042 RepID=UPI00329775AD